ncbi:MAG: L-threonylcarbamoyladenylate synthase [Pseudomonadota bacterium]
MTLLLNANEVARAAELLCDGALVAFPTETVYGLGADATRDISVARIFEAKNRPSFNPLIVHLPDMAAVERLVVFDAAARALAKAFWPGPMSLVLPLRPEAGLSDLVTAGLGTVALRVPSHPLAQEVLRAAGRPIAAPSANPSGKISPTTAAHVMDGLRGRIDAVIDGGACAVGLESSIFGGDPITMLRPGGVTREQAEEVLGKRLATPQDQTTPNAPGQLASHYAPDAGVRLNVAAKGHVPHLGFGAGAADLNLSAAGDMLQAAAHLFGMLREMDALAHAAGVDYFTVAPVPMDGIGLAINDRLNRAAAPRT